MSQGVDSIVLLSGGLDSSANLALAVERGDQVVALTVNYGQRAWPSEQRAVQALSEFYGIPRREIEIPFLGGLGGSSLTDTSRKVPEVAEHFLDQWSVITQSADAVWVPNRNAVLIQIACAWAEASRAKTVLVGFNKEEAATFPDNTKEFLDATNHALFYSTRGKVRLESLTLQMTKREIVSRLRGLARAFPFDKVWSCYYSGESPCGKCESCQRLIRAVSYDEVKNVENGFC